MRLSVSYNDEVIELVTGYEGLESYETILFCRFGMTEARSGYKQRARILEPVERYEGPKSAQACTTPASQVSRRLTGACRYRAFRLQLVEIERFISFFEHRVGILRSFIF